MRRSVLLALLISTAPLFAQDAGGEEESGSIERGADLLSEGARLLLRGILDDMEPAMRDMARVLENWSIEGLNIDDLGNYHPPEVLPNGDIIIRRKMPLVPDGAGPEVEL